MGSGSSGGKIGAGVSCSGPRQAARAPPPVRVLFLHYQHSHQFREVCVLKKQSCLCTRILRTIASETMVRVPTTGRAVLACRRETA